MRLLITYVVLSLSSLRLDEEVLWAQDRATVRVEENLRAEPQGTIIGRLLEGTSFSVLRVDGRWVELEVMGWIWNESILPSNGPGFDLAVSLGPHENLRAEPSGPVLALLLEGALLEKVGDRSGWTQVRRVAWSWGPSLDLGVAPNDPDPVIPVSGGDPVSGAPPEAQAWWRSGGSGAPILTGPDGDTLADGRPGAELQVLARQGNWARVRLEGWVWAPAGAGADQVDTGIVSGVTPEEVVQNPQAHQGAVVSWELQFVSLEEAERVRTDFYEGEPFLLTRANSPGRAFVYVAIPPERLAEVEGLIPLERIRVVGRIRTGAAALTDNPVLDLLELTRR